MRRLAWCLPLCLFSCSLTPDGPSSRDGLSSDHPSPASHPCAPRAGDGKQPVSRKELERLARTDPVAFLEKCLERYDREVRGYRVTLVKQERLRGRLGPKERIEACFREEPFSVRMDWKEGG